MPAAGRRTMPRPAVGVRPSTSFYAPAVPRGLRLCGGGFGEYAFYICEGRRKVGRSGFRLPPCREGCGCAARASWGAPSTFPTCAAGWADRTFALPPCRAVCGCVARVAEGMPSTFATGAARGARFSFTTSIFFQMSTLIRLRRTAHLPGGTEGVLFFPAESGQSPMATLEPPASGRIRPFPRANIRSASTWFRHDLPARPVDGRRPGGHDCRA